MEQTGKTLPFIFPGQSLGKWKKWLLPALLFFIALLYFRFLPVSYDFDGTVFSQHLRYALMKNSLLHTLHPHHLFYFPCTYWVYQVLQQLTGYRVLEYFHLQLISMCFGVLTLWFVHKILRHLTVSTFFSLAGTLLIAVSFGTWYHAVEANEYIAGLFFITAGLYYLYFRAHKSGNLALSAFFLVCSAGFHLTNGLIVFSCLLYLVFVYSKERWKTSLKFLGFYSLFLSIPYIIYYLVAGINIIDFFKHILGGGRDSFAGYAVNYWSPVSLSSLFNSFKSVGESMIATETPFLSWLSIIFLVSVILVVIFSAWKSSDKAPYKKMLYWLLPYMVFFTAWDNRHIGFKLNVMLPLLILFIYSLSRISRCSVADGVRGQVPERFKMVIVPVVLVMVVIVVFSANFFSSIEPATFPGNNGPLLLAQAIREKTPENAVIVISGCGSATSMFCKIYIPYFAYRQVMVMDWLLGNNHSLGQVLFTLQQLKQRGIPVFFLSELTGSGKAVDCLRENHHLTQEEYSGFIRNLNLKPGVPLTGRFSLFRL